MASRFSITYQTITDMKAAEYTDNGADMLQTDVELSILMSIMIGIILFAVHIIMSMP